MNTRLHALTYKNSRPIKFFMTAGQISDYTGAAALRNDRGNRIRVPEGLAARRHV